MTTIVFSKDRALQLHAFLRSYEKHVTPTGRVHVLYATASYRHQKAYEKLFDESGRGGWVVPCRQIEFKKDLLSLLPPTGTVVFFVDDMVFIRPWTVREEPGLSLRLGLNLTSNYASASVTQVLPLCRLLVEDRIAWRWCDGRLAWGYPLSLDGHLFDLAEIRPLIELAQFGSPNTLESSLQQFVPQFLDREGTCYRKSKVVNVPWNRVQDECPNRVADGPTSDDMLDFWENGQQIDLRSVYGVVNQSTHQEFAFRTEAR